MADIPEIPHEAIGLVLAVIVNGVLLVWHASSAWTRFKDQATRIGKLETTVTRLEARIARQGDDLMRQFSEMRGEIRERLVKIETKLELQASHNRGRTGS
jgi:hypothetical protein